MGYFMAKNTFVAEVTFNEYLLRDEGITTLSKI